MKKDLIYSIVSIGVLTITGVFSTSYLSRTLTKVDFGFFSGLMLVLSLTTLLDGLRPIVVFSSSRDESENLSSLYSITCVLSVIGAIISLFYINYILPTINIMVLLSMSFAVGLNIMVSFFWGVMEGKSRVGETLLIRSLYYVLIYLSTVILIYKGYNVSSVSYAIFFCMAALLLTFYYMSKSKLELKFLLDYNQLKKMILVSKENLFFNIIVSFMYTLERTVLSGMRGVKFLGIYSSQYELSTRGNILAGTISNILFPFLCDVKRQNNKYYYLWRDISYLLFFVLFIIISIVSLQSNFIITLYLGDSYSEWHLVFRYLLVGLFMNSFGYMAICYMRSKGNFKTYTYYYLMSLILALCAVIPLVKYYGVYGACISYLLLRTCDILLFIRAVKKTDLLMSLWLLLIPLMLLVLFLFTIDDVYAYLYISSYALITLVILKKNIFNVLKFMF